MTPQDLEELCKFIDKNLAHGFIQPARPKMASLVLFCEKKDGCLCVCIDYRCLNVVCMNNVYSLPLMKDMLVHLSKGKIFSKLDLWEAYYWIRIKEGDKWKIAFNSPLGCFPFKVLPFGLQVAQLINKVLHEHLYKGILVYLDNLHRNESRACYISQSSFK